MRTNKKTCEVAIHYNSSPHVMQDFTFQCIDKVNPKTDLDRIEKILSLLDGAVILRLS